MAINDMRIVYTMSQFHGDVSNYILKCGFKAIFIERHVALTADVHHEPIFIQHRYRRSQFLKLLFPLDFTTSQIHKIKNPVYYCWAESNLLIFILQFFLF